MEIIVPFTQCNMDNISLSERPLKNGLFLRIGKYFFKIFSSVGNQTYKLYLSYYTSNRNKSYMLLMKGKNDKKDYRVKGEYENE